MPVCVREYIVIKACIIIRLDSVEEHVHTCKCLPEIKKGLLQFQNIAIYEIVSLLSLDSDKHARPAIQGELESAQPISLSLISPALIYNNIPPNKLFLLPLEAMFRCSQGLFCASQTQLSPTPSKGTPICDGVFHYALVERQGDEQNKLPL